MDLGIMFLLYLTAQADQISDVLGGLVFITTLCALCYYVVNWIRQIDNNADNYQFPLTKNIAWTLGILIFINAIFPSTKTLMIAVGGSMVVQAAQSDRVKGIADTSAQIVEKFLKEQLEKEEKEKATKQKVEEKTAEPARKNDEIEKIAKAAAKAAVEELVKE